MKKYISLLLLVLFSVQSVNAQKRKLANYSYKVSMPYEVFDATNKQYLANGDEALAVKFDGKKVLIQKFNSEKPAFLKQKEYESFFPKNYSFERILKLSNKFYFFYSSWDGDKDKEQLFSIEIDFAKGEFVDKPKLVFQVDGKVTGTMASSGSGVYFGGISMPSFSIGVVDKFDFFQDYNKNNLLIQYRKKPTVKRDTKSNDIIGLVTLESNLAVKTTQEITMPYTERRMNNLDYQLDNKGNLYMLTKVFHDDSNDDKKRKRDTEANFHIELFTVKAGSNKIEISKFENKDKFINKLLIFDTPSDYLICCGTYSNGKGDSNDCDGVVSFKIKSDGTIYDKNYYEIPVEVINQFEKERTRRKNEKNDDKEKGIQFEDLYLTDVSVQPDGSFVMAGEQYKVEVSTSVSTYGTSTSVRYFYSDILAIKINSDGTLAWMKKVPKRQRGNRGQGGMSYKYFNTKDSHYFVFLDHVDNFDLKIDQEPKEIKDGRESNLTAIKLNDADGALSRGTILNSTEVDDMKMYQFSTDRILKTSENSFMLEVYKKKKEDIMIKVNLN